ncbi:MAG: GAF domain-containing protein [Armatimonadota bacterium]|nr:GAF domain-containing protein [Armatimonadota bacterium]MDR7403044.1 GAF domain-containing protein [Armatimonadota bacterium]
MRARLMLLILLITLPAVGMVTYDFVRERHRAAAEARGEALRYALLASRDVENLVETTGAVLAELAQLPDVRSAHPTRCRALLEARLSRHLYYANLGVIGPDGLLRCSALPFTPPVDLSDRAYFQLAVSTRSFVIGDYQVGRVTGRKTLNFGYPLVDDQERIQGVVFAALDLGWLDDVAANIATALPQDATLTLLDREGTVLVRRPDPDRWVGRTVPEAPLLAAMVSGPTEGTAEAQGLDGRVRFVGYRQLRAGVGRTLYLSVGIPRQVALGPVNAAFTSNLATLFLVAVAGLVAAWAMGTRLILQPVDALTSTVRRLAAGDLSARTGWRGGPGEVGELARAFDEMAGTLQRRTAEREAAEAQILRQLHTLTALYAAAQKLTGSLDSRVLADDVVKSCVAFGASLAWVGPADPDGVVRPASRFPADSPYLDGIVVRWDDSPAGQGPVGRCIRSGAPAVVEDVDADPAFAPWRDRTRAFGYRTVAAFPLVARERPFGVLALYAAAPGFFTPERVEFFQAYAHLAAAALDNARLFEETEQSLRRLQALRTIDVAITSSLDLRVTLDVLLDQVITELRVDAAAVLLLNPHSQHLECGAARGFAGDEIRRVALRPGEGHAGRAILERRTVVVPDLRASPDTVHAGVGPAEAFVGHCAVPLLAKGQVKGGLVVYSRLPLDPSPRWMEFLETLAGQAAIAIDNAALFADLQRANLDLRLAYETTLEGWSRALDLRDRETEGHTQRVADLTVRLARALGVPEEEIVHIRRGALLHDIGKMGIPDAILLKPGPLTEDEWAVMRRHPDLARQLLWPIAYLRPALDIPYCHHERWDGTGYPRGLRGGEIPLAARIFAVVDVWDALRSDRPYRPAWPAERALQYIREQAGRQFDPEVVRAFVQMMEGEPADVDPVGVSRPRGSAQET